MQEYLGIHVYELKNICGVHISISTQASIPNFQNISTILIVTKKNWKELHEMQKGHQFSSGDLGTVYLRKLHTILDFKIRNFHPIQ